MEIYIDGNRSTDESWHIAYGQPAEALAELTTDEKAVASQLRLTPEQFSRIKLAAELATPELAEKAAKVSGLAQQWLDEHGVAGTVSKVIFNRLLGRFRLEIETSTALRIVNVRERVVDDLLELGSREAGESLRRLFDANLNVPRVARAS